MGKILFIKILKTIERFFVEASLGEAGIKKQIN